MQDYAVYLFIALLLGWILWQRFLGPRMHGVKSIAAADYMKMRHEKHTLIDVREDDEWETGHAPGAHHIPLGELRANLAHIPKDKPIVVICASGNRSAIAATLLAKNGCTQVLNFSGGMGSWIRAGLPVVRSGS